MSTAITLWQIAAEFRAEADKLTDLELDEQTLVDTLEGLSGELEVKAANVAHVIGNIEAMVHAMKQAEENLKARRKAAEGRAKRLRQYLHDAMNFTGIKKVEHPQFAITVKANPEAVDVFDLRMVPAGYLRTTYTVKPSPGVTIDWTEDGSAFRLEGPREALETLEEPSKDAIKVALKAAVDVPGCRLTRGTRLEIK